MSITKRGQQIEKMAGIGGRILDMGKGLMEGGKDLGRKIVDSDAADTARLMKEYPEEIPGYLGQKGKDIVDGYESEIASGTVAGGASAAGTAIMSGDKGGGEKKAGIRRRFGLDSDASNPEHSGTPNNRFSRSLA